MGEDVYTMVMDSLVIAGRTFTSRLIVGTGKYKDGPETQAALAAAGGTTDQSISIIDSALLKTPVDREGIKSAIIVARDSIHAAHSALKDAFKAFAEVSITTDSH